MVNRAAAWCAAVILAGALGCDRTSPSGPTTAPPAVDQAWQARVITWGFTGVYFLYSEAGTTPLPAYDNLVMLCNFVRRLAAGRASPGSLRILYTTRRPQAEITDPQNRAWYGPFLDAVASLGTVEFALPSRVEVSLYNVVIYDPCELLERERERGIVQQYLNRGGAVLVLGDNSCHVSGTPTTQIANQLLSGLGISFTSGDPKTRDPLSIPVEQQTGVFEGVAQVSVFRVAPQVVSGNAAALLKDGGNILAAIAPAGSQ